MADYNKPIRKNKRKKDPPWAEAFDRGEITPEQERKILADKEFKSQMALSDKYAKRAKGWSALAKGVTAADTISGLAFPLKGAVKAGAKLGKKLIGKTGKKGKIMTETISDATKLRRRERPDAPFRKSTDKEAEWYRGKDSGQYEADKYHMVRDENVRAPKGYRGDYGRRPGRLGKDLRPVAPEDVKYLPRRRTPSDETQELAERLSKVPAKDRHYAFPRSPSSVGTGRPPTAVDRLKNSITEKQQFEANKAPRWERTPSGKIKATGATKADPGRITPKSAPKPPPPPRGLEALADDYIKAKKSGRITLKSAPKPRPVFRAPAKAGKADLKKHVKKLDKKDVQKYVRKAGSIGLQPARPLTRLDAALMGTAAGGAAGIAVEKMKNKVKKDKEASKRLKKSITDKATKKKKAPRAIPIHGPSDTRPAPKALPTSKPLNSPDARFRGYRIKLDKDGKETGVPYYVPPAKKK